MLELVEPPHRDWARDLSRAILDPDTPAPPWLNGPSGRPAGRRLSVYRNNVAIAMIEALAANFPVLERLLGAESFRHLARLFLVAHPPRTRILHEYGSDLPGFLSGLDALAELPFLADVARLELARLASYHAADAEPLDGATIAAVPAEQLGSLRFKPHPATRLVRSRFPVVAIWRANQPGSVPERIDGSVAETALVTRPRQDVLVGLLDASSAAFVEALLGDATLLEAASAACEITDAFDLAAALRVAVISGAFASAIP